MQANLNVSVQLATTAIVLPANVNAVLNGSSDSNSDTGTGSSGTSQKRRSIHEHFLAEVDAVCAERETIVVRTGQNSIHQQQQYNFLIERLMPVFSREQLPVMAITGVEVAVPTYRAILAQRKILVRGKIGSGAYSKVKLAFRLKPFSDPTFNDAHLEAVAVKIIDRQKASKDYQTRFMPRELAIWMSLRHPTIIQLFDTFSDPLNRFVFMVSEFAEGGDCLRYVRNVGSISESTASSWIAQLCCGVQYMHSQGVSHRDLKLENLLLDRTATCLKIGDLGFARIFNTSSGELSRTYCGSKSYAAPEILKGVPYDAMKCDVWAIGVIAYIILTGKMPFNESLSNRKIIDEQRRLKGLHWDRFPLTSLHSHNFVNLALTFAYQERPAVAVLIQHEWLMPYHEMIVKSLFDNMKNSGGQPPPSQLHYRPETNS